MRVDVSDVDGGTVGCITSGIGVDGDADIVVDIDGGACVVVGVIVGRDVGVAVVGVVAIDVATTVKDNADIECEVYCDVDVGSVDHVDGVCDSIGEVVIGVNINDDGDGGVCVDDGIAVVVGGGVAYCGGVVLSLFLLVWRWLGHSITCLLVHLPLL